MYDSVTFGIVLKISFIKLIFKQKGFWTLIFLLSLSSFCPGFLTRIGESTMVKGQGRLRNEVSMTVGASINTNEQEAKPSTMSRGETE